MAPKLLPGDVTRMSIPQHNGPVLVLHLTGSPLDTRFLTRESLSACFGSSIDVGPGVEGIVQHGEDAPTAQGLPDQFAFARALPQALRKTQMMHGEMFDHREG